MITWKVIIFAAILDLNLKPNTLRFGLCLLNYGSEHTIMKVHSNQCLVCSGPMWVWM